MGVFRVFLVVLAMLCVCGPLAFAAPNSAKIISPDISMRGETGELGKVIRVIDGDNFMLATDAGEINVSLAGIEIPKFAWPDKGYEAWPLAGESKKYLQELIRGKTVQLYYSGDRRDRYGRAIAQVRIPKTELWLQEEMVRAGYARVYSWNSHVMDTARLYSAEIEARTAKRGIWDNKTTRGFYAVRAPDPNPLAQYVDKRTNC